MGSGKVGMPCDPCCSGGGTYPCGGCPAIPGTLYYAGKYAAPSEVFDCDMRPNGTDCVDTVGIVTLPCAGTIDSGSITYTLSLVSGSITVTDGVTTYTATQWWDSGVVSAPADDTDCYCPPLLEASPARCCYSDQPTPFPTYCYRRALMVPVVISGVCKLFNFDGHFQTSAAAAAWTSIPMSTAMVVHSCSPFSAGRVGPPGSTYYPIVTE